MSDEREQFEKFWNRRFSNHTWALEKDPKGIYIYLHASMAEETWREARKEVERLRGVLNSLKSEASGFVKLIEPELRQLLGNTNVNCLLRRIQEASEALSGSSDSDKI